MKKIKHLLVAVLLLVSTLAYSQVTTSSMSGKVTDGKEPLIGATVKATHQPSGTNYGAATNAEGRFSIQGMRTGGPYKIEVIYLG
ncbi:MAG: carboxypeptidase-like regulatory domain-containing protein, partial [Dysgonamonadaceae bacterium]|nr:carboxypeptidase-like regulatory domain-containing protein [Dysgonamonadaceae bacterium]